MANHKSAKKRIRSNEKKAQANKRVIQALRKLEKQVRKDIQSKNKESLEQGLKNIFQMADKAKTKGVIKKNTANRKKARFSRSIAKALGS